jgi:FlaA1/EpsC-like NDP-sugar epimerase
MLNGKSVLITGGAGLFGHAFIPTAFVHCSNNNKERIKENKDKIGSF